MFESHWWSRTSTPPPLSGMWFQLAAKEGKRGKVVLEGNFSKTNVVIVKHVHEPKNHAHVLSPVWNLQPSLPTFTAIVLRVRV